MAKPKQPKQIKKKSPSRRRRGGNEPPQHINSFQRHSTLILFVVFFLSLFLLIGCIVVYFLFEEFQSLHPVFANEIAVSFFCVFGSSNAMMIFRLFGINLFSQVFHGIVHLLIPVFILLDMFLNGTERRGLYAKMMIVTIFTLVVYVIHCVLAFHCVVFRPGLTRREEITRSGFHAFFGFMIYFILIFNHFLLLGFLCEDIEPTLLIILSMWYILLSLFILLTPFFEYQLREKISQRTKKTKKKKEKTRRGSQATSTRGGSPPTSARGVSQPTPTKRQKELHLFT